jgi:hypothetical protein
LCIATSFLPSPVLGSLPSIWRNKLLYNIAYA